MDNLNLFISVTSTAKSGTDKCVKLVGSKSATDTKIAELNQKMSDRFNCLEALLMVRTFEPTFSLSVKVTPTHSPAAGAGKDTTLFIRLSQRVTVSSTEFPGTDSSAVKHQSTSKTQTSRPGPTSSEHTGINFSELQSISPPVSSSPTNLTLTKPSLHILRPLQSTLVPTPLLQGISSPASSSPADLKLTDPCFP